MRMIPTRMTKLSKRLHREMKENKWTYEQFAAQLGISKSQLHNWANGTHQPTLANIRALAKKLKCGVYDLIEAA